MSANKQLLSYATIAADRKNFIRSGTRNGSDFNKYDTPSNKYFKILFYFENGDSNNYTSDFSSGGLLAPTWLAEPKMENMYTYNSAYSYLKLNDEEERADLLKDFISLLSNISSESPWYFKEVSGLDAALERKTNEMKFEDRKKISIKCLNDSYDDRIGTLMDLYRAVVWSWQMKREIIPSNLRKFDMGIYIFSDVVAPFQKFDNGFIDINIPFLESNKGYASIGNASSDYRTSYKYIEFHNCEFDYNSAKTPYGTLDSTQGLSPEYTIDIYFDDCYETRYNEFMMKEFGDMIMWDVCMLADRTNYMNNTDDNERELRRRMLYPDRFDNGALEFLSSAADQLISTGVNALTSKVKRVVLGNLHTFSLTKIGDQISSLMNGNVMGAYDAAKDYINRSKKSDDGEDISNKNIFNQTPQQADNTDLGSLFKIEPKKVVNTDLGNLFTANTLVNNL